jgi:hypothetical protein
MVNTDDMHSTTKRRCAMHILPWRWKIFNRKKLLASEQADYTVRPLTEGHTRANIKKHMAGPPARPNRPPPSPNPKKQKIPKETRKQSIEARVTRINCTNLIHFRKQGLIADWHCETQAGRSDDCPLYLEKSDECEWHAPRFIPLSEDEIEAKITEMVVRNAFEARCVEVKLCPNDGHDLIPHRVKHSTWQCPICDFVHNP